MKICPRCNSENLDEAKYCHTCGQDLNKTDLTETKTSLETKTRQETKKSNIRFLAVFAIIVIIAIAIFSITGIGNNEPKNITLIKENAYGFTFVNDGVPYYNYYLNGVFTNLNGDFHGYDLKADFYDVDNNLVKEDHKNYMRNIFLDSQNSQTSTLASIYTNEYYNISHIQVEITNPDGDVVFNESVKFDMAKMDLSGLNRTSSSTSED